jgi:hypothetical protein
MSREDWLNARAGTPDAPCVGGSEVGAILGVDPYRTALQLWLERTGRAERREPTEVMEAGRYLEDGVLRWYAAKTGRQVLHGRALGEAIDACTHGMDRLIAYAEVVYRDDENRLVLRSRLYPWLQASLDAVAIDPRLGPGVVDAKCTGFAEIQAWREGSPEHYRAQVACYTLVTGLQWGGFAVMFGGRELGWSDEPRDTELESRVIQATRLFRDSLARDVAPEPDRSGGDTAALRTMHRNVSGRTLLFPTTTLLDGERVSAREFDERWLACAERLTAARQEREVLETHLRATMGDAREIVLPDGTRYCRNPRSVWRRGAGE